MTKVLASIWHPFSDVFMPIVNAPWQIPVARRHIHTVPVAILARSRLTVRVLETDIDLQPFQILIIPANLGYRFVTTGGIKSKWTTTFLRRAALEIAGIDGQAGRASGAAATRLLGQSPCLYEARLSYTRSLRRLLRSRSTRESLRALSDFLTALLTSPCKVVKTALERGPQAPSTSYVLNNITRNLPHSVELAKARSELGMNAPRIISEFKSFTGVTPQQFLRCRRAHLAVSMAADGVSLKKVADVLGFANPAHLTSSCYKFFGVSPTSLIGQIRSHRSAISILEMPKNDLMPAAAMFQDSDSSDSQWADGMKFE